MSQATSGMQGPPTRSIPLQISVAGGILAIAIGAMVLLGWTLGSDRLISIDLRLIAMLPNTAMAMVAGGTAILLLQGAPAPAHRRVASVIAVALFLLGLLVFLSRQLDRELLWVGGLFRERVAQYPYRPVGLFATNSTIAFMLTGLALGLIDNSRRGLRATARVCSALALAISSIALLGHLYGARALYTFDRFAGMALLTALGFASLQVGILFLRPNEGAISLIVGNDLAGRLTRRLMPLTVGVPLLLGVLVIQGREENLFSRETGIALFVVCLSVWIVGVLLVSARYLRNADDARSRLLEREQQLRAAAESANRTKSEFLGVMSHELRTPLNAIVGYVDLMQSGTAGAITAEQGRFLTRMKSSASHLVHTVSDILTLIRLDAGSGRLRHEPVPLGELIDEVAGILQPLAHAKSLTFVARCDSDVTLFTDRHRVRQILINLGGNAVKFTPRGSVTLTGRCDGDVAFIEVADTGIGIAEADHERIFDEFWQVEGALTRSFDGAGLGLAVSRRLARQLDGEVRVTSSLGSGSTFTLTLPAKKGVATSPPEPTSPLYQAQPSQPA